MKNHPLFGKRYVKGRNGTRQKIKRLTKAKINGKLHYTAVLESGLWISKRPIEEGTPDE